MKHIKRIVTSLLLLCMVVSVYAPFHAEAKNSNIQKKVLYINQTISMDKVENVSKKQIKWTSNNKEVVRVTSAGKVKGLKKGTATVKAVHKQTKKTLVIYKVTVKAFTEKEMKSNITVVSDNSMNVMKMLGKKYCVVNSKKELEQLKKDICSQYVKAGYGTKEECKKTEFYKQLCSYKKSFFKNKTLCITEHMLPYAGQSTETGKFIRKQTSKGKVYGELDVTYLKAPSGTANTTVVSYQEYFIEMKKDDANVLQDYKISVTKQN